MIDLDQFKICQLIAIHAEILARMPEAQDKEYAREEMRRVERELAKRYMLN